MVDVYDMYLNNQSIPLDWRNVFAKRWLFMGDMNAYVKIFFAILPIVVAVHMLAHRSGPISNYVIKLPSTMVIQSHDSPF